MPEWMWKKLWKRDDRSGKSRRSDDRGVSFVEVVVSMLIMAIAVIPLLGSFMMSLRVNMKSRQAMSATIVAQNVMECVKEYANTHTVVGGVSGDSDMKNILPSTYGGVAGDGQTQAGVFSSTTTGFHLENVLEGVHHFYVEVEYKETSDLQKINAGGIPNLETLDQPSTVIISPRGVLNGTLEEEKRQEVANRFMDQWVQSYNKKDEDGNPLVPSEEEKKSKKDDILKHMEKKDAEMVITIVGEETSPDMKVAKGVIVKLDYAYSYLGSFEKLTAYDFVGEASSGMLENIYIFYDPFVVSFAETCVIHDKVKVINEADFEGGLYFAVQESKECLNIPENSVITVQKVVGPKFETEGIITKKVKLYCSTDLQGQVSSNGLDVFDGNVGDSEENRKQYPFVKKEFYQKMKNVEIRVYRQLENGKKGELLTSMETDLLQ